MKRFEIVRVFECADEAFELVKRNLVESRYLGAEVACPDVAGCTGCELGGGCCSVNEFKSKSTEIRNVEDVVVLTEDDKKKLEACLTLGLGWVARDMGGDVFAYCTKPCKGVQGWVGTARYLKVNMPDSVKWLNREDEEPTEIRILLQNKKVANQPEIAKPEERLNQCKNCMYAQNYDDLNGFECKVKKIGWVRAERYDCDDFLDEEVF